MQKNNTNQERGRKYGGSSSFVDARQPSRAPRQDEDGRDTTIGSTHPGFGPADGDSAKQGISNRPANEEHAFPDADKADNSDDAPGTAEVRPAQVGGNRGRV
jgi:hypothetical protein